MIEMLCAMFLFLGGYGLGRVQKGLTININKGGQPIKDGEYNQSTLDSMNPNVRQYYESTNGLNDF